MPFSATSAGAAITTFGVSLIANDGLMALLAMVFTIFTFSLVVYYLF